MDRGDRAQPAGAPLAPARTSTRTSGSCTTPRPTGPRRTTSPANTRRSCASYSGCSSSRPPRITSCRWTTAAPSGPTPTAPAARCWPEAAGSALYPGDRPAQRLLGHQHQEQVARGHRGGRGAERRLRGGDRRPGRVPGGWAIYAKDGRPAYCYNFYGIDLFHVDGTGALRGGHPPGPHGVRLRRRRRRQGRNRPLFVDDDQVGEGRVERTQPLPFASDEPLRSAATTARR